MNDDLLKYNPEEDIDMDKEIKKTTSPSGGGSKLSTIFLIVLGVHVLIIIGVSAYHLLKGNKDSAKTQDVAAVQDQIPPVSDGQAMVAGTNDQPTLETSATFAQQTSTEPSTMNAKMSTPSMSDPVWNMSQQSAAAPAVTTAPATAVSEEKVETMPVAVEKPAAPVVEESVKTVAAPVVTRSSSYTVAKGDTLSKISRKTGASIASLRSANHLKKDVIKVGQKLTVPASGKVVATTKSSSKKVAKAKLPLTTPILPATPVTSTEGYHLYKVAKGDTLNKIARLFHTTPAKLSQINGMTDPNKLKVGMELKVPGEQMANRQNTSTGTENTSAKPFRTPVSNTDLAMLRGDENM